MSVTTEASRRHYHFKAVSTGEGVDIPSRKRVVVGRLESCDLILNDSSVSAIHAVIEFEGNKITVYDMHSKNGTYVGGQNVVAKEISIGEQVSFANSKFTFHEGQIPTKRPLNILSPEIPDVIGTVVSKKSDLSLVLDQEKKGGLPPRPITFKDVNEKYPSTIYPLSADINADNTEYIFEDIDELYPIFQYDVSTQAMEVICVFGERVYSVNYYDIKNQSVQMVGHNPQDDLGKLEYPYWGKEEKIPFLSIQNNEVMVQKPFGFDVEYLSNDKNVNVKTEMYFFRDNDVIMFHNGEHKIFVRKTPPPPNVKTAPFLRRDPEFKKYLFLMLFFVFLFLGSVSLYPVNEELKKEKVPETLRTIIYKPKFKPQRLTVSKTPAVDKTKKAPKRVQKSPTQKIAKKKAKSRTKKSSIKNKAKKNVTKIQKKVRRGSTTKKRAARNNKSTSTSSKSKSSKRGNNSRSKTRNKVRSQSPTPKSRGTVDAYSSNNLKSTMSSLLAKGSGKLGVRTRSDSTSFSDDSSSMSGGSNGEIKRTKVSKSVGSLTGATTGRIDTSETAKGLVNKRTIYTAGIPSETVVLGSMDPDVIRKILQEHIPQFRYCYQKVLDKSKKEFSGRIYLSFTIGSSGHVTKTGLFRESGLPATVKTCVMNVLKGIKFPEPLGGGVVGVQQPFNFYPNVR